MLEKLSNLLGEELSKQVEELLTKEGIELGILNDGTLVPASKHDSLKIEHKELQAKYTAEINKLNKDLETLSKQKGSVEELQQEIEKIKTESQSTVDKLATELETSKKVGALNSELIANNVDKEYLEMIRNQINLDNLKIDGENIIGTQDVVKTVKEKFPKLFGEVKKVGTLTPNNIDGTVKTDRATLIENYNKIEKDISLNPAERARRLEILDAQIKDMPK